MWGEDSVGFYECSEEKIKECKVQSQYQLALDLIDRGNFKEAYGRFIELKGYKDSNEKAYEIFKKMLKQSNIGDKFVFGTYEQDENENNGPENIEWQIIEKEDEKVFVISEYILDRKQIYCEKQEDSKWENSSLRTWLNETFINIAFEEKKQ